MFYQDNSTGDLLYRRGTIDVDLGQNELEMELNIYPNPSSNGLFTVQSEISGDALEITNALGQKVEFGFELSNGSTQLDLSKLSKGIYFLSYQSGIGVQTTRTITIN